MCAFQLDQTCLHIAARRQDGQIVFVLLRDAGADPHAKDKASLLTEDCCSCLCLCFLLRWAALLQTMLLKN